MGSRIRGLQPSNASAMLRHPVLCRPLLRPGLPPELLLNGLHDEVHEGDVVGHAVELQATEALSGCGLPIASRLPRPSPSSRLLFRSRRTPWTAPTPATADGLRLRGCGRHHGGLLPVRHLLGNRFRRTTGTTGAPCSTTPAATTAPTILP